MLIFNCSRAFADFIELAARHGVETLVTPAPSPDPDEDAAALRTGAAPVQQWLVHLVRLRRKPCVLAMELRTRYAMVFTGLKKGDAAGFINALIERLANEMAFAANKAGMALHPQAPIARFLAHHHAFRFFLRAHRSAQAHLKEVAWQLAHCSDEAGGLPVGHEACAAVDAIANRTPRKTSTSKDYLYPGEEMLVDWLITYYAGVAPDREALLDKISRGKRNRRCA